jgi:hypothetical protein
MIPNQNLESKTFLNKEELSFEVRVIIRGKLGWKSLIAITASFPCITVYYGIPVLMECSVTTFTGRSHRCCATHHYA